MIWRPVERVGRWAARLVGQTRRASETEGDCPIRLHFHPQVCCDTGQVPACDLALILTGPALRHPQAGDLLEPALAALRRWDRAGHSVATLTFRAPSVWLGDPAFVDELMWEADRHEIAPARLTLSINEWALMPDAPATVSDTLRRLADLGTGLELADFGTGSASPAAVAQWNLRGLRIARPFTTGCGDDPARQQIILSILSIADRLGIPTVAEEVVTPRDKAFLAQIGCHRLQGPAVSTPLTAETMPGFLARQHAARADLPLVRVA